MQTVLDKFGRVVIPKQVRLRLGLKAGALLKIEEREHQVLLGPRRRKPCPGGKKRLAGFHRERCRRYIRMCPHSSGRAIGGTGIRSRSVKILFDTSVLVAAMVEPHPNHDSAFGWLQRAKANAIECIVCSHTLAELYAVLTALPVSPKISPGMARRLIRDNVLSLAQVVTLSFERLSFGDSRGG